DPARSNEIVRTAALAFAEGRAGLLETAIAGIRGDDEVSGEPIIPDTPLGRSAGDFIAAWFEEEAAFQADAVELYGDFTALGDPYRDFWGYESVHTVFRAP